MQQSEAFHQELRAAYAAIVADSFARARHCLSLARLAQQAGDCAEVRRWIWCVRVLRIAAGEWRKRAQRIAPVVVCLLLCLGCAKPAPREFTVDFDVQPSSDGGSVRWTLRFSRSEFHTMVDTAAKDDGNVNDQVHADVRALIRAGLESHHLVGCRPVEQVVAKLDDGFAFFGTCPVAHAMPTGGI
jgi:hypothetical protein